MHPALRKGPLFTKHPPPFHFLSTGLSNALDALVSRDKVRFKSTPKTVCAARWIPAVFPRLQADRERQDRPLKYGYTRAGISGATGSATASVRPPPKSAHAVVVA